MLARDLTAFQLVVSNSGKAASVTVEARRRDLFPALPRLLPLLLRRFGSSSGGSSARRLLSVLLVPTAFPLDLLRVWPAVAAAMLFDELGSCWVIIRKIELWVGSFVRYMGSNR